MKIAISCLVFSLCFDFSLGSSSESEDLYVERRTKCHVTIRTLNQNNLMDLKKINSAVIPIHYTDNFYREILRDSAIAKLAYYGSDVACGICARTETENGKRRLYIMTLGCLKEYRRLHVGTVLINMVVGYAERVGGYDSVYLHVQKTNTNGILFYQMSGFKYMETLINYYYSLNDDGYVYEKFIENSKRDHWGPRMIKDKSPKHTKNTAKSLDKIVKHKGAKKRQ